jgi:hypothetical protein
MKRDTNYSLHGHILEVESWSKYLGVNISDDLTWRDHIEKTASKVFYYFLEVVDEDQKE